MLTLNKYLLKLIAGEDLSFEDSYTAGCELLKEHCDHVEAGALLSLLSAKGETVTELLGFHKAFSESGRKLNLVDRFVDIVGTGGDRAGTLNISTGASLLTAACGIPVIKHGNRAMSSQCGSADVLAELGFNLDLSEEELASELARRNFIFCFAPNYYPVWRHIAPVRKKLALATIFNLLGPLLNPAGREHMLFGVYSHKYVAVLAEVLFRLGTTKSLVFHANGLDELSSLGTIKAKLVTKEGIADLVIDPEALGLKIASMTDLRGGDRMYNAQMLQRTLNGEATGLTDSLILNAGAALFVYGAVDSLADGVARARARIQAGGIIPLNKLQQIIARKYQAPTKRKSMKAALKNQPFAVISEIKRASPSAGVIAEISDPLAKALQYVNLGAAAISVLTDAGFNGSLADLQQVATGLKHTPVPVLCKDFMLSAPQIAEAAAHGADVILLIVHVLKEKTIELTKVAHAFGLEVLVEVHNEAELAIALAANADIIGVNQRDLNDFSMHPQQFAKLIKLIPSHLVKVAESGIKTREQALAAIELGFDGVLVGEALSRLANPAEFFGVNTGTMAC